MEKVIRKKIINILLFTGSIVFLIWPALINGYPLFYSDSASYIVSGYLGTVPIDRPIAYGFLVRHISMSFSLWFVVLFQAMLAVLLIWLSFRIICGNKKTNVYTLISCSLIGILTGASNYISQIMPDIFSAFMIWSLALLFIADQSFYRWLLFLIVLLSSLVHFSNLLTITALSGLFLLIVLVSRKRISHYKDLVLKFSFLLILPWVLIPTINYSFQKEFFLNKSSNIFFTGRLIESGILKKYFSKYAESSKYSLYQHREHLPDKCWQFAWNQDSPLYEGECIKSGWGTCWLLKSDEYGQMIRSALSKPDLLLDFVKICLNDWIKQIYDVEIGPLNQLGENSDFKNITSSYFDDAAMFTKSKQFHRNLIFKVESSIQLIFLIISILMLIVMLSIFKRLNLNKGLLIVLLVVVAGLLINALFCSMFSGVLNRYQGRVAWLIPLASILFLFSSWGEIERSNYSIENQIVE